MLKTDCCFLGAKGVRLCDGVKGRGLYVDEKGGGLEYAVGQIVSAPTNGAFACWFRMDEDAVGGMWYNSKSHNITGD